jgi:hypothetical protein
MSVQVLQPRTRCASTLSEARRAVRAAGSVAPALMDVDELTDSIELAAALESQVAALRLSLVAEADRRQVGPSLGASGTDAWAARLTGSTRAVMAGGLWLARQLEERYDATREAFADGAINEAQVRVIVRAAETLPDDVTDEERRRGEAGLVVKAVGGMDPRRLRQAARRMLDVVDRDRADRHEAAQLRAEERRAQVETWLTLRDSGDGTWSGRFVVPELAGSMLRSALERLGSPRRLGRSRSGELVHDDTLDTGAQQLSWSEQLGHAFVELVEHLPTEASGGFSRVGASLLVHIDHDRLLDELGSARLDTGVTISAGEARRLACGAGIIPVVLGTSSEPLDLGRTARLHNTAMRRAASVVHDTCAAEGCERPFAWCDLHHPHAWGAGGPTSLANSVPLCGRHHRCAHDGRFDLTYLPSGEVRYRRRC